MNVFMHAEGNNQPGSGHKMSYVPHVILFKRLHQTGAYHIYYCNGCGQRSKKHVVISTLSSQHSTTENHGESLLCSKS